MQGTIGHQVFSDGCVPGIEEEARAETRRYFAEQFEQLAADHEGIQLLEDSLPVKALMMNLTASKASPARRLIDTDDGQWQKNIDLSENVFACHRPVANGAEYAIVEHFPQAGTNEIWVRGWSSIDVLHAFIKDQCRALRTCTEDVTSQVREYLSERYPGCDVDVEGVNNSLGTGWLA